MRPFQKIVISLIFVQFMANLEQSGGQVPEAWTVNVPFY